MWRRGEGAAISGPVILPALATLIPVGKVDQIDSGVVIDYSSNLLGIDWLFVNFLSSRVFSY